MLKIILLLSGFSAAGLAGYSAIGGTTSCPSSCPLGMDCPPDCGDACTVTCTKPDGTTCELTLTREGDRCVVTSCQPLGAAAKAEACPPACCPGTTAGKP